METNQPKCDCCDKPAVMMWTEAVETTQGAYLWNGVPQEPDTFRRFEPGPSFARCAEHAPKGSGITITNRR